MSAMNAETVLCVLKEELEELKSLSIEANKVDWYLAHAEHGGRHFLRDAGHKLKSLHIALPDTANGHETRIYFDGDDPASCEYSSSLADVFSHLAKAIEWLFENGVGNDAVHQFCKCPVGPALWCRFLLSMSSGGAPNLPRFEPTWPLRYGDLYYDWSEEELLDHLAGEESRFTQVYGSHFDDEPIPDEIRQNPGCFYVSFLHRVGLHSQRICDWLIGEVEDQIRCFESLPCELQSAVDEHRVGSKNSAEL